MYLIEWLATLLAQGGDITSTAFEMAVMLYRVIAFVLGGGIFIQW